MKKKRIVLLLLLCNVFHVKSHSRTFFQPRDVSTDSTLELSLVNYDRYHAESEGRYAFYVKPFFVKSTKNKKRGSYFLPNNKTCITLDESGQGDVDPLWVDLISAPGSFYTSNLSLAPARKVAGALFTLYFDLCDCIWFGINTAVMQVTTNAHLCEVNRTQEGTIPGFANAYDAFNNQAWSAGRITKCNQEKSGFDDIQLKLGYDFYITDSEHATLYLVGTIPTGERSRARYLFEPLVGTNYGSFGIGFDGEKLLYECESNVFSCMLDIKYRYIFPAYERRSFDLCKNGDWSRYLLVVTEQQPLDSQPGINLLTFPVRVTPGNTIDLWTALHYEHCAWDVEVGYEFWWRQAEKLCKKCHYNSRICYSNVSFVWRFIYRSCK